MAACMPACCTPRGVQPQTGRAWWPACQCSAAAAGLGHVPRLKGQQRPPGTARSAEGHVCSAAPLHSSAHARRRCSTVQVRASSMITLRSTTLRCCTVQVSNMGYGRTLKHQLPVVVPKIALITTERSWVQGLLRPPGEGHGLRAYLAAPPPCCGAVTWPDHCPEVVVASQGSHSPAWIHRHHTESRPELRHCCGRLLGGHMCRCLAMTAASHAGGALFEKEVDDSQGDT